MPATPPLISGQLNGQRIDQNELSGEETSENDERGTANITGVLPIDLFGRNRRAVEAARANLAAAKAELRAQTLAISADIAQEYLSFRGNQRQLELLRESVSLQEKTLDIVTKRFNSGLSPELDLQRARTSVENLRADIPPLVEELKNNRYRLATLTGQYPGQLIKNLKTENNDIPDYVARIPDNLPLSILRQRPDIIAAEARLRQATANIGIALADYYPDLDLTGSVTITTGGISGMDMLTSTIGAMIDQIIFDGGIRKADVKSARAQTDAALANYEQSLRLAAGEVEESLSAIQASLDRQASLERVIESSSRSFDQAETLYQQGLISFLDVVDAQRVLADGEQSLARERTNYATQIARLFEVLGLGHTKDMGSANS